MTSCEWFITAALVGVLVVLVGVMVMSVVIESRRLARIRRENERDGEDGL